MTYLAVLVFIVGLCLGSFYNVVILRSLSGESIVFPPSKCPKCGQKLKPWHNIPVISYILLKGRCAYCKEKISIQYPIVELVTGILFLSIFLKFGINLKTLLLMFSVSCLIIMVGTDLKEKIVDCTYAIAVTVVGLIYAFCVSGLHHFVEALLGAVLGFLIVEVIARLGYLLKKGRAMGEADSYVAAALGALVGLHNIGWVLLYSLIASMVFVLPSFWYDRYKNKDALTLLFSSLFIMGISFNIYFKQAYWVLGFLILTGAVLTFLTIKSMRTGTKLHYMPFVPALGAGFLYYVFFVL